MADAIQSIADLADRATLVNNQDTVDADEHNTTRTATQNAVNLLHDVVQEQDKNYASATAPTLKSEGKIWCDITDDPAVMKYYKDGSNNDEELVGATLTQTLTNKTLTNPVFSPAGAKAYIDLGRDLNLKVTNNSTNPNYQIDVTFDYLTLYDVNGRGAVESKTSALTLDLSSTGAGGRAVSENSGSEQVSKWYYVYVYSDGAGTINGLLAQASDWATVITNTDNPSGSGYVRRIGAVRNDSGSDFLYFVQVDSWVAIESSTIYNLGSTTSTSWVSTDISSLIPLHTSKIRGVIGADGNSGSITARISPTNLVSTLNNSPGLQVTGGAGATGVYGNYEIDIFTDQTCYIANATGAGQADYGLKSFKFKL